MGKRKVRDEHHRRPKSLDGTDDPRNISIVDNNHHKWWHIIFGNMNAYQICGHLNLSYHKPQNTRVGIIFVGETEVIKVGKRGSSDPILSLDAWNKLFKGKTFGQIVEWINDVFGDPEYCFELIPIK